MNTASGSQAVDATSTGLGNELAPVVLAVTPKLVREFSVLANDRNATHYDDAVARAQGFPAALAHGAIAASLALRVLTANGIRPFRDGDDVEVVFVAAVPIGETLTARARVARVEDERLVYDVWCENRTGQTVVAGVARLLRER